MQKIFLSLVLMAAAISQEMRAEDLANGDEIKTDYSLSPYIKRPAGLMGLKMPPLTGSIGEDGLGGGLRLNYSSFYSSEPKSDVIDCLNEETPVLSPQVVALSMTGVKLSCSNISEEDLELYTVQNCQLLRSCTNAKLESDNSYVANFMSGPKMAAKDLAVLLLEDWLPVMEKLEALRKYSDKKFGAGFSASCQPQFELNKKSDDDNSCDSLAVEQGFSNMISTCNKTISRSCYDVGDDFGKNLPDDASAFEHFMKGRVDTKVTSALAADTELLEQLGQVFSSKEEKTDAKIKSVFDVLKKLRDEKKLDPVFGFDSDHFEPDQITKSVHYVFFKDLASKKLSLSGIKAEIERHRRNTARNILTKDCPNSWNFENICKKTTAVANGKGGLYASRVRASSRLKSLDSTHAEWLKSVYPKAIADDRDARIFLNSHRCVALGVIAPPLTNALGFNYNIGQNDELSLGLRGSFVFSDRKPIDLRDVKENKSELASLDTDGKGRPALFGGPDVKKSGDMDVISPDNDKSQTDSFTDNIKSAENLTNNSALGSNFAQQPVLPNVPNTNFMSDLQTISESEAKKVSGVAEKSDPLNDKIAELSKKLSATEEHLAKLNEDKAMAEEEKAVQKKKDDDSQTIAELQKQIASLKAESLKTPAKQPAKTDVAEVAPSRAIASSFREPAVEKKKEESEQVAPVADKGTHSSGAMASAVSDSGAAARPASAPASASQASALGGKPLLVLSKADGMTAEKITETINDKIIELGGQSFEIEENGVKIEIIPEVKNGKVLLDAKGKPRYVKKIKGGKEAVAKSRVPASVTDRADLLRKDEEAVKRERAEYLKLRNITNQAVQKKK